MPASLRQQPPYRVVVWAPGTVGHCALAEAITHPDLELVGVFAYSPEKVGVDAGALCGLAPTGVTTTGSKEDALALDADVVIHCASKAHGQTANDEDLVRLLESGKNVITTTSYTHLPTYDPALCRRIERACEAHGVSFFGTGENPGLMLERVVATLTGVCHRIDQVVLDEYADCARSPESRMIMDLMSMGRPPEEVTLDRPMVQAVHKMYLQALHGAADVLGLSLDRVEQQIEVATLDHDLEIAAGTIRKGTVAAQRLSWIGVWQDRPFLTIREHWVCTREIPRWEPLPAAWVHGNYWRIRIEGLPSLRLDMDLWMPEHDAPGLAKANAVQLLVAMTAMRAIGEVCQAPPGIVQAPVFAPFRPRQV